MVRPRNEPDLDRAIELDPDFALAYAAKAWFHSSGLVVSYDVDTAESERLALENAERALSLDPSLGLAYLAIANLHAVNWRWAEAREAYEVAYDLSPNDITVLTYYGRYKRSAGDYADAPDERKRCSSLVRGPLEVGGDVVDRFQGSSVAWPVSEANSSVGRVSPWA